MRSLPLAGLVLVAAACGSGVPSRAADIDGFVTNVTSSKGVGTIRIEEDPSKEAGDNKASVRITERTAVFREVGGVIERIALGDVRAGERVRARAWFTGPVAQSYPVQAEAEAVLVWTLAP